MRHILGKKLGAGIMTLLLLFGTFFQTVTPVRAEETGTDITGKVTIDSISSPNAEIKDSSNVSDFSSFVASGANVDYKIGLTVNKGTPIQADDFIEIPFKADRGALFESHGLSVYDSEDGSLLGKATITKDKIRIKFTKKNNTKTAAKITISTTLKGVSSEFSKGFPTQAEVDAAYAKNPTGIDKVKILDKSANVNVKSNYWVTSSSKFYGDYPVPAKGDPASFFKMTNGKSGILSSTNTSTYWNIGVNRPSYKYELTSPVSGKKNSTTSDASTTAAFLFGYDPAFGQYSATETSYVEDLLPGDTYKNIKFDRVTIRGTHLYKDGKTPILRQDYANGKVGGCWNPTQAGYLDFDKFLTKREAATGQSYEDFKASLKPGEYGIYKNANGDMRLVLSLGKVGSKDPKSMYTWGDLCAKLGKETIINSFFPTYEITATNDLKRIKIPVDIIYNQIKDWPITDLNFVFKTWSSPSCEPGRRLRIRRLFRDRRYKPRITLLSVTSVSIPTRTEPPS